MVRLNLPGAAFGLSIFVFKEYLYKTGGSLTRDPGLWFGYGCIKCLQPLAYQKKSLT